MGGRKQKRRYLHRGKTAEKILRGRRGESKKEEKKTTEEGEERERGESFQTSIVEKHGAGFA